MPKTLLLNQNVQLSSPNPDIDWSRGDTFYLDTTVDETFTFSNVTDGRTIIIIVRNNDVSTHTMNFPAGIFKQEQFDGVISALTETVFTLIRSNGKIYITEVKEMDN